MLRDCDHLFFTFTSMDSELKRWEARQQLILDVLESHVGPQREPAPDKPTRFGTICLNALGNSASNKSTQLRVALKQATRFFCTLVFTRIGWSALEERLQEQLFQPAALPNCTRLANTELQNTHCKVIWKLERFMWLVVSYHRPHKILFVNVSFAAHKGTFANFLQNLSFCVTETTCFLRLHLWKKKCCKPWERQPTNPFHFGVILARFQTT